MLSAYTPIGGEDIEISDVKIQEELTWRDLFSAVFARLSRITYRVIIIIVIHVRPSLQGPWGGHLTNA